MNSKWQIFVLIPDRQREISQWVVSFAQTHTHLSMIRERSSCSTGNATLNTTLLRFLAFIIILNFGIK